MNKFIKKYYLSRKNAGFTLIELLVVVLIIGILAAVAVPQYERAVMKTRVMSLMPILRAIDNAQQVYYMANGSYTVSFDDLDISMPAGATVTREGNSERFTYKSWGCLLRRETAEKDYSYSAYCYSSLPGMPQLEKYFFVNKFICWGGEEGSKGYSVCRSISNRKEPDTASSVIGGFTFQ